MTNEKKADIGLTVLSGLCAAFFAKDVIADITDIGYTLSTTATKIGFGLDILAVVGMLGLFIVELCKVIKSKKDTK